MYELRIYFCAMGRVVPWWNGEVQQAPVFCNEMQILLSHCKVVAKFRCVFVCVCVGERACVCNRMRWEMRKFMCT